jgi:hypothetical protein
MVTSQPLRLQAGGRVGIPSGNMGLSGHFVGDARLWRWRRLWRPEPDGSHQHKHHLVGWGQVQFT